MTAIHRNTDSRSCGASTVVTGNGSVFANNLLVSVNGDPNSHGGGSLSASTNQIFAENLMVVEVGDSASPDALCIPLGGAHCGPSSASGSTNVFVGS